MRRLVPAVGLFFLAPLVAEYLLGDIPVTALAGLIVLAPWYGGGALLIRETCRRAGWGWPGIVALGLAFGVVEEGLVTESLFDPGYAGKHLLAHGYVPGLGIGASWTVFVLTLHVVWSICTPIAMVELLSRRRPTTTWLGRIGLGVTAVLFVAGGVVTAAQNHAQFHFVAPAGRLAGAAVVALLLVVLAAVLGRGRGAPVSAEGRVPPAWLLGTASLVVTSVVTSLWYLAKDSVPSWLYVVLVLAGYAAGVPLVRHWSGLRGWGPAHRLALAAGALLTYAWQGFVTAHMLVPASPAVTLVSHVVFALGALVLVAATALRIHRDGRVDVARPGAAPTVETEGAASRAR
ncbi:MAG TPA: hypothetical protein VF053_21155 [Streptosporangiales bacterium]